MQTCESLIYPSSTVAGGQPSLSPQPIVDTLTQLDEMLKKLEQAVMDVIKDIDHKKKVTYYLHRISIASNVHFEPSAGYAKCTSKFF